ncbi:MAG: hypothetical protein VZR11_09725 [Succinimonas sp.]|nr:hypothetical protein [Succinimonas sp.]
MAESGLPSLGMLVMLTGFLTGIGASLLMPGDTLLTGVCRLHGGLEFSARIQGTPISSGNTQSGATQHETPRSFTSRVLSFPSMDSPAAHAFESALIAMVRDKAIIDKAIIEMKTNQTFAYQETHVNAQADIQGRADRANRQERADKHSSSRYPLSNNSASQNRLSSKSQHQESVPKDLSTTNLDERSYDDHSGYKSHSAHRDLQSARDLDHRYLSDLQDTRSHQNRRDLSPGEELAIVLADQAIAFQEYRELKDHPLKGLPLPEKRRLREQLRREREMLPRKLLDAFYRGEPIPLRTDVLSARDRLRLLSIYFGAVWHILSGEIPAALILILALLIDSGITRYLRIRDGYLPVPRVYRICTLGAAFQIGAAPVLLIPFLVPPALLPTVFGGGLITGGAILYGLTLHISARPSSDLLEQEL